MNHLGEERLFGDADLGDRAGIGLENSLGSVNSEPLELPPESMAWNKALLAAF